MKQLKNIPLMTEKHRNKPSRMSDSEIITILIMFYLGGYKYLKHFYINYICKHCHHLFPKTVSYNRFVELEKKVVAPMLVFVKEVLLGKCTGIDFVDSTPLRVCLSFCRAYSALIGLGIMLAGIPC